MRFKLSFTNFANKHGFTLIELLVVISIISMLSSIVLANVNVSRKKAVIAAALVFEGTNYHAMGTEEILHYNFDEPSGNPLDGSGNNVVLTLSGCATSCRGQYGDTPTGYGYALSLDGKSYGETNVLSTGNDLSQYTISVWIKPISFMNQIGGQDVIPIIDGFVYYNGFPPNEYFNNRPYLGFKEGTQLVFRVGGDGNHPADCTGSDSPKKKIIVGEWQLITVDSSGEIYINGNLVDKDSSYNDCTLPPLKILEVGTLGGIYHYVGEMDNLVIYRRILTATEIHDIYADTINKRSLADK